MSSLVRYAVPRRDRPVGVSGSATGRSRIVTPGKAAAARVRPSIIIPTTVAAQRAATR